MVHMYILLTQANNTLTPDRAVLVASIMAGCEIDFALGIIEEIHDQVLGRSKSIPFSCLVHKLCIDARIEIIPNVDLMIDMQHT